MLVLRDEGVAYYGVAWSSVDFRNNTAGWVVSACAERKRLRVAMGNTPRTIRYGITKESDHVFASM